MSFHIPVGIFSCDRDVVTRLTTIIQIASSVGETNHYEFAMA
jgi:hypothetical protein